MSRTLAGNQTGRAAHGIDDINSEKSSYYQAIEKLMPKAEELFPDKVTFSQWLMKIPTGKMLEYLQEIVADQQEREADAEWLGVSPTRAHVTVIANRLGSVRIVESIKTPEQIEADEVSNRFNFDTIKPIQF